jgi:SAM-dependent methyltransferase
MDINQYLLPPRLKFFRRKLAGSRFRFLDVGLAAGTPTTTKAWFPECEYYGLDITSSVLRPGEDEKLTALFLENLDSSDLSSVPDGFFDVIVMSHVIEHLRDGLGALAKLATKLAPGGHIYIEWPSVRSFNLPRGVHFTDDPTHVRSYAIHEIANVLLASNLKIIKAGRRREWLRILLSPLTLPRQIKELVTRGRLHNVGLWDLLGFADFVYAVRPKT